MKKAFFVCCIILIISANKTVCAADLLEVYQQALVSDPIYQQAVSQRLADKQAIPLSLAPLLPSAAITAFPNKSRSTSSGSATDPGHSTQKGYTMALTLTQTLFDFGQFAALSGAKATANQADATLIAAAEDLMIRLSTAYFQVLQDEDTLVYIKATRTAFAKQLDQVKQQYDVGLKTITDVYTAQASYEKSVSDYIGAENALANDKENLRAITGVLYPTLSKLREDFPLISPEPANMEEWVTTTAKQNWSVKAAQYAAESARQTIKQQFAGHFPTLNVQGTHDINYIRSSANVSAAELGGSNKLTTSTIGLNLNVPLAEGGLVIAQTAQAKYNYQVAEQQVELQLRNTMNQTRKSFLNVTAGITKIAADKQAIKSAESALEGMEAGYQVGTEILVNVLDQQQKVFQAEQQYAIDRYSYVTSLLSLKQAAGTLSPDDLAAINAWLYEGERKSEHETNNTSEQKAYSAEDEKKITAVSKKQAKRLAKSN